MPYKNPVLDPPTAKFEGLSQLLDRADHAEVLSIHGMCTHDKAWAYRTKDRLDQYLPQLTAGSTSGEEIDGIRIYSTKFLDDSGRLRLTNHALVWSGLTQDLKADLCFDASEPTGSCPADPGEYERTRARLNGQLKSTLLNDCFSDAVIYLGPRGTEIRRAMRETIQWLSDQHSDASSVPLVLVSESLGSKILVDALNERTDSRQALIQYFEPTELIFMAANQVPLLDLATADPAITKSGESSLRRFLDSLRDSKKDGDERAIQVISFTDPNDLLGYEIPDRDFVEANVIVSNDRTYFGWVENPNAAHRGYLDNASVWEYVVCGSSRKCDD